MNEAPIPFAAYVLIGITTAVLAAVTFMDKNDTTTAALPVIGGKKSKTRKNKH
jgi:hypothetical protein